MQGRPIGFAVFLGKSQGSKHLGALEWARENIEASLLYQFVPQVRVGHVRKQDQTAARRSIEK
jgi:hypothetical protein